MNYYNEIKNELINNEINRRVKNYSINKSDLDTYYNVGKLLVEAGKHYGESIIKEYSKKLQNEVGKKYSETSLKYFRLFYNYSKSHSVSDQLSYTHYKVLLSIKDNNKINYYVNESIKQRLSVRQLQEKIKNNEYERLPKLTKNKLITKDTIEVKDLVPSPILIRNKNNIEVITEKTLHKLILEDMPSFLKELGHGFAFIDSEYKIKIGSVYHYIDLLLFNIEYNCYIVIELKVTKLKKEYIGQTEIYMNYIDDTLRKPTQDQTIGIIICKEDNKFIMKYCSDKRISSKEYELV